MQLGDSVIPLKNSVTGTRMNRWGSTRTWKTDYLKQFISEFSQVKEILHDPFNFQENFIT